MGMRPPLFDDVQLVGVAKLKYIPSRELRWMKRPMVITGPRDEQPLAVIVPYATYIQAQEIIVEALKFLQGSSEVLALVEALERAGFAPGARSTLNET